MTSNEIFQILRKIEVNKTPDLTEVNTAVYMLNLFLIKIFSHHCHIYRNVYLAFYNV